MGVFLDRVDAAPISNSDFPFAFNQWISVLVDTLNENIADIQAALMSTSVVTLTTQNVEINSLYIPTNVAQTVFQLPNTAVVGSRVTIAGQGAGGWQLLTGSGQTIEIPAGVPPTAVTSVTSSSRYDSIEIICVLANVTWIALSTSTTGFVIV